MTKHDWIIITLSVLSGLISTAVYEGVLSFLRRRVAQKRLVAYSYPDLHAVEQTAIRAAAMHHQNIPIDPDEHRPALSWLNLQYYHQDRATADMAEAIKVYNQTKMAELGKLASLEVTSTEKRIAP